ncbi:hypothetical protein GmRootV116_37310 [Variovorax sp. V116]
MDTERAFASLGHQATAALRAVVVGIGLGCWYWLLVLGPSEAKAARSHPFCMRRGAQMEAGSGPQLFERNAVERVLRTPAVIEHRRLPAAKRRDADSRVAFLLPTFLWRSVWTGDLGNRCAGT